MVNSYFSFAGRNSPEFKIGIDRCRKSVHPRRIVQRISVPGRNGDLVFDTGMYENVPQEYDIWFNAKAETTTLAAADIAAWLLVPRGYQILNDTYDPDVFRRAMFLGPLDVENWMRLYGRCRLTFDCMPQRFLKSGEMYMDIRNGETLLNRWQTALPLIQVTGSGTGVVSINGVEIEITTLDGTIWLDCENRNAYNDTTNLNNHISVLANDWPKLPPGENTIRYAGGVKTIKMKPRWWAI